MPDLNDFTGRKAEQEFKAEARLHCVWPSVKCCLSFELFRRTTEPFNSNDRPKRLSKPAAFLEISQPTEAWNSIQEK